MVPLYARLRKGNTESCRYSVAPPPQSYVNPVLCPITRRDRTFHARDVTHPSAFLRRLRHFSLARILFGALWSCRKSQFGLKCCKKSLSMGERTGQVALVRPHHRPFYTALTFKATTTAFLLSYSRGLHATTVTKLARSQIRK